MPRIRMALFVLLLCGIPLIDAGRLSAQGVTAAPYHGILASTGIPLTGLIAAWDFTTASGQTVNGSWGTSATMELGSGSGSDSNDPSITSAGLSFSTDDYCRTSAMTITSGGLTVIAVINPAWQALGGYQGIFSDSVNYAQTTGIHMAVTSSASQDWAAKSLILFGSGYNSGEAPRATGLFGSITSSTAHSIGGSLSTTAAASYLDGAAITSVTTTGTVDSTSSRVFYVGREISGNYLNATMSYLLVWNRSLTAAEHVIVHRWLKGYLSTKGVSLP